MFVPYIHTNDYLATIQAGQLDGQILDSLEYGNLERNIAEDWAISKIKDKLGKRYDFNL
jgi:hypothetical protein